MKNLLLLLAMLIFTTTAFSQLYVAPNATTSTDSYIYVSDEFLFVEQDVNLVANTNNADTEASIYLRNDGQLIQGSTASNNNGTGTLSVYQTIDSTSYYHYTFWHSPVGLPSGAAGNTMAGVSRIYDADAGHITRSNQTLTTTNSNGSTGNPITISTKWFYKRLSSTSNEVEALYEHVGTNDDLEPEYGFIMKGIGTDPGAGPANSQTYDFRGRPYNGNINTPIVASATTNPVDNKWTLAGNPYASAMDLKIFFADNIANGLNAILYWDEPKDSEFHHNYVSHSGGYGIWLPGSNGAANDPGNYVKAPFRLYDESGYIGGQTALGGDYNRRYAPIGQGFVLQTESLVIDDIEFKNNQRVFRKVGDVSDMRSQNNSPNSLTEFIVPQIRFHVNYVNGPGRELLLLFSDESTDGYDIGLDAPLPINPEGTDAYFSILTDNGMQPFAIQTLPFENNKEIPINFLLNNQYNISVISVEVLNFNRPIYLWDSLEDTYKEITSNPNSLTNFLLLPSGHYQERFFIVFKNGKQMLNDSDGTKAIELARASVDFFQNNPYKQMEISNPDGYTIKNAKIFDMTGKLVVNKDNLGNANNISVGTSNLSDGVYLIKLLTSENININYKMIIKNN